MRKWKWKATRLEQASAELYEAEAGYTTKLASAELYGGHYGAETHQSHERFLPNTNRSISENRSSVTSASHMEAQSS